MFKQLIQLIFPSYCPACDRNLVEQEGAVCFDCLYEIEETGFHTKPHHNPLFYRFAGKVPIHGAAALYYFDKKGKLQKIVKALKYDNRPQVGRYLGQFLGVKLKESGFLNGTETLIPVPLHRSRQKERGYNQSEEIARGLQKAMPGLVIDTTNLLRREKTATQTKKSRDERWENVSDVFELRQSMVGDIVLVDDVITTGATLEACIRTLQAGENPPRSIRVVSLAMAR